jgi:hypothetical protein
MPENNQNTEDTLISVFKFSCFLPSTKHDSNIVQIEVSKFVQRLMLVLSEEFSLIGNSRRNNMKSETVFSETFYSL